MIVTPSNGMFLDFQNNRTDKGFANLTWNEFGTPVYTDGVIGRALGPVSGTNHIDTIATTNPFNVGEFFSMGLWFKIPATETNKAFIDIGAENNTSTAQFNRGLAIWYFNGDDNIRLRIDNKLDGYGQNPTNQRGYYSTFFAPPKNVAVFFAATRTSTQCYFYMYDATNGWQTEELSYTATASSLGFASRRNRIGALGVLPDDNSLNVTGESDWISRPFIYNKVLSFSDIKRIKSGMHPING